MIKTVKTVIAAAGLAVSFWSAQLTASDAGSVDFSCMAEQVKSKHQLSAQHKEYDVVIRNNCPGSAYWAMCIERIDPFTQKIMETHTPSGLIEKDARSRVNLQMRKGAEDGRFRNRFQEFYVTFGYAIEGSAVATCSAAKCEAQKKSLRAEISSNEADWKSAHQTLQARLDNECPDSGWNTEEQESCRAQLQQSIGKEVSEFEQKDADLRAQLASTDPLLCTAHGGDLVPE